MPDEFWERLAKGNYLDYRKIRALKSGRKSAKMIAAINALDSKLAVRGRVMSHVPSRDIVQVASFLKTAQAPENHQLAMGKLESFLDKGALSLKEELELLARHLLSVSPAGVKWVPGPLKKIEKAMGKTVADYDYAWGANKDLVRGTLVCDTSEGLAGVATLIQRVCQLQYGMFLVKADPQASVRDGGTVTTGYSGWNFVVQFKDHNMFGAEVQANTVDMMYGKMSKEDFCENLDYSESEYNRIQFKLGFPGGLGHALYDIQDTARSHAETVEGDLARTLCLDYNDACRGQFRCTTLMDLNIRIREFGGTLTSPAAKELWKHGVEGSSWSAFRTVLLR